MIKELEAFRKSDILIRGRFVVEHYNKDGKLLDTYYLKNNVTTQGKNKLFDVMFHGDTPVDPWYIGIIDATGWVSEPVSDTLAAHSGWTEFTGYTGNRKEWTEGAASGQSITNGTSVDFAITSSGTLKGILIASAATGTSGILWATADFASNVIVSNGDTVKITYTVNA
jgi:hypothetical protein